ncbi:hypothetical protein [Croceibacter atlanticus]|nr:hypothetical protein VVL01_12865 [Croceibacter atlanticus]
MSRGRYGEVYYTVDQSDVRALVRGELKLLERQLKSARSSNTLTKYHYDDLEDRINLILNPEG